MRQHGRESHVYPASGLTLPAGIHPSAVTTDPGGAYVYVTDQGSAEHPLLCSECRRACTGGGSPFPSGNDPSSIIVEANGKFAAVTESKDSSVSTYAITNGALTRVGSFATGLQPVAVGIDPRLNKYLFTANFLGNNVSGFALDVNSGTLLNTQYSPFTANANPTAVAAIPHNGSL